MISMRNRTISLLLTLVGLAAPASAQLTPPPIPGGGAATVAVTNLPGPPIRALPQAVASTTEPLMSAGQVRALSDGRVLVNDGSRRRLLMFDSTLALIGVIADSAIGSANAYGTGIGVLLAYRADSSLLIDPASLSMLVIDPAGQIVRVRAVPRTTDVSYMTSLATTYGFPGFDAVGRMIYRGPIPSGIPRIPPGGGVAVPVGPDSAAIRRIDLATRVVDSIAMVKGNRSSYLATQSASGMISMRSRTNPMPLVDEWAVMADGSVAIVRGRDYHIDWVEPDGRTSSSPKMPFDWQRLDLDDKTRVIDSLKTATERTMQLMIAREQARYDSLVAVARETRGPMPTPPPLADMIYRANYGPADELPDYRPPFSAGAARGDADNNLWIRTNPMRPTPGGPVYDVVNRQGEVIDRIQFTGTRTLVGFGPGGVVYVLSRGQTGAKLDKVRVR
jgi:hypothetical protein